MGGLVCGHNRKLHMQLGLLLLLCLLHISLALFVSPHMHTHSLIHNMRYCVNMCTLLYNTYEQRYIIST